MKACEFAPGTLLAGKFCIVRLLGEGGMGSVYEVEHRLTGKRCALKLLHPHIAQSTRMVARFWREVGMDGKIGNPHIVEVHDAGVLSSGEPYLMMELLSGETLAERIARKPPLGPEEICEIMSQVCEAIQAAHVAKIVHRDLKPQNLFLTAREGKLFVKVLDFGICKLVEEGATLTSPGTALGTPAYMPPEQLLGQGTVDERSDIYSLGVILYECATGRRPFPARRLGQLGATAHYGKPLPIGVVRPDLPESFCNLVARAMAVEKAHRFGSARELGEALRRACDPERDTVVEAPEVGGDLNLPMVGGDLLESTVHIGPLKSKPTLPSPPEPSLTPSAEPVVPFPSGLRREGVRHRPTISVLLGLSVLGVVALRAVLPGMSANEGASAPTMLGDTSRHDAAAHASAPTFETVPASSSGGAVCIPTAVTPSAPSKKTPTPQPTPPATGVPTSPLPSTSPPPLPEPEPVTKRT